MPAEIVKFSDGSYQDVFSLGQVFATSGFFQDARQAAQAVVKILAGKELGFGPVASMTGIHLVKGRVTLSANLIAAAIKRSKKYNYKVKTFTDQECLIEFYENGELAGSSGFSVKQASAAGLSGDNWRKYPRNMLFARAMSNGAKWYCADVFSGPVYTPEEMESVVGPDEEVNTETGEITKRNGATITLQTPSGVAQAVSPPPALTTAPKTLYVGKELLTRLRQGAQAVGEEVFREVLAEVTQDEVGADLSELETLTTEEGERILAALRDAYLARKDEPKPEEVKVVEAAGAAPQVSTVSDEKKE